jgi:hypothetical protein
LLTCLTCAGFNPARLAVRVMVPADKVDRTNTRVFNPLPSQCIRCLQRVAALHTLVTYIAEADGLIGMRERAEQIDSVR